MEAAWTSNNNKPQYEIKTFVVVDVYDGCPNQTILMENQIYVWTILVLDDLLGFVCIPLMIYIGDS